MKFSIDDIKELFDKDKLGGWIEEHKRQVAVGCITVCLVIVAGVSVATSGGKKNGAEAEAEEGKTLTASAAQDAEVAEEEALAEANELEKDAYPEVNDLVNQYYEYMSAGDVEGLASVEDEISEEEQNRILRSKDLVEGYQNIACYTKKGLEDGSYLVFVYYELKFSQIDTPAPGLSPLYVYPNDEGKLVIFNGEASEELNAYVQQVAQEDDVMELREEVKTKYEEAKTADENLAKQEERYLKIAQNSAEEEIAEEEQPAEETPEETTEENPAEEAAEENTDNGGATAQNRETRFTESVRLRSEPSTDSENLGTAFPGESVTQIESYDNGWSKINYNGKECYCMTEYLE